MNRGLGALIVSFAVVSCLVSCAGTGDWIYELPNHYEVWHINSRDVVIKYADSEGGTNAIPLFVKEFAHDDRYVFSRNIKNISENNILREVYYILDTKTKEVCGPLDSMKELLEKAEEWGVKVPDRWYRTSQNPNIE